MNINVRMGVVLAVFAIVLSGCHRGYVGKYYFVESDGVIIDSASEEDVNAIDRVIRNVANEFNFVEDVGYPDQMIVFSHSKRDTISGINRELSGSGSLLSLAFNRDKLIITLRDYSNREETAFLRSLKNELDNRLKNVTGGVVVKFDRKY